MKSGQAHTHKDPVRKTPPWLCAPYHPSTTPVPQSFAMGTGQAKLRNEYRTSKTCNGYGVATLVT